MSEILIQRNVKIQRVNIDLILIHCKGGLAYNIFRLHHEGSSVTKAYNSVNTSRDHILTNQLFIAACAYIVMLDFGSVSWLQI